MNPSKLHQLANKLREQNKSVLALQKYEEVLIDYLNKNETELIINVLLEKIITYRHLYKKNSHKIYLDIIYGHLVTTKQLATNITGQQAALLEFSWGEYYQLRQQYKQAVQSFSQAIQKLPAGDSSYGNFQAHLGWAVYLAGDPIKAQQLIKQAIQEINNRILDHDSHEYKVWLSGAKMKLAQILVAQNKKETALELLHSLSDLLSPQEQPLRYQQLEELQKELSS